MSSMNPLSIPGGWNKDSPAVEEKNPVDLASVPRTAAGVVNESGEIVNDAGETIGKITDSKNPQDLAGNTVTAAGDIVSDTGNVLGKAVDLNLGGNDDHASEYTTEAVEKDNSSNSGFNVLGKTKGLFGSLGFSRSQQVSEQGSQLGLDNTKPDTPTLDVDKTKDDLEKPAEIPEVDETKSELEKTAEIPEVDKSKDDLEKTAEIPDVNSTKNDLEKTVDVPENNDEIALDGPPPISMDDKDKPDVDELPKDVDDATKDQSVLGSVTDMKEGDKIDEVKDEALEKTEEVQPDTLQDQTDDALKSTDDLKDTSDIPVDPSTAESLAQDQTSAVGEQVEEAAETALDFTALKGTKVNKAGNLVNDHGDIIGKVTEGEIKQLVGKMADENGDIWNDSGKKVGKGEPLPDGEREDLKKDFAPFENFPDAVVEADGKVVSEGRQVGVVVEGDPKRLKGSKVDEDGDILDRRGNVVGKAEAWDEPEAEPEVEIDYSILAGKRVNKLGNVVSTSGEIYGRVIEGNVSAMVGRMCDKQGNIRSESGDIIGKAELVPEGEREGSKDGPFAELVGCTVAKDGKVVTPSGDVVGRLVSGDPKVLFGRAVDQDGDVVDKNGNVLAKAERWEEPEVEKKHGPMAGGTINRDGNVLDDSGNIMGKLISGDVLVCAGKEIDDDGDVINSKGHTIGHVALISDIPPEPEPEETPEEKEKREQVEKDKKLAGQLASCIEQSLDKIRPICKMITDKIDRAERTPKEELDEEALVKQVKPLIEEGGKILTETNGVIRGLDPDGRIQRQAKHKSNTREATPEEFHLADVLKELTGTVTECIDNAKRKIEDMPHAKEELNPLWGLLAEPLFQILAAVGLLLNGVLGLVGRLLSGLGLGGLVDNLLGGLGIDKLLGGLGLGDALGALTGKNKKK